MRAIGVDLGGTWIRAAVADSSGIQTPIRRAQTLSERTSTAIIDDLVALVQSAEADSGSEIHGIGVAIPTTLDASGRLDPCPNLPTMPRFPIRDELNRRLGREVWLENDARCFALGEWFLGEARHVSVLLGVTLGTSVGLGIVNDGRALAGANQQAGEIWRSPAELDSDSPVSVHDLLRGDAVEELYRGLCGIGAKAWDIAASARQGDAAAAECFARYGRRLGRVLAWVCNVIDPDAVVLGGSVASDFGLFGPAALQALGRPDIRLLVSRLGDQAGVLGAALGALGALGRVA